MLEQAWEALPITDSMFNLQIQGSRNMLRQPANTWFLLALSAIALYLSYLIAKPFLSPIFAAVVLAVVFYPIHVRITALIRRPNLAATISTLLVMLVVAIPTLFLGAVITRELRDVYQSLSDRSAVQGGFSPYVMHLLEAPLRFLSAYIDVSRLDLRSALLGWLDGASRYLMALGTTAVSNIFSLALGVVVAFFTLFFLFRDANRIKQAVADSLPLTAQQRGRLTARISETIVASAYGGIAVGLVQGSLTGVAFWILGLHSPVLWGSVAGIASLVPVVGTAVVWVPGAVVLFVSGHWVKALILAIWGALIVSQIDALVRPYVVSGRAKMHNLLIFFALLGGVEAFGIMGVFIGPVIASITVALLLMLRELNISAQQNDQTVYAKSEE